MLRWALAVLVLLPTAARAEGSFQWSNAGNWKRYCGEKDLTRPELEPLIARLKETPESAYGTLSPGESELVASIAARGKDALPYALRLNDDQEFYFSHPAGYIPDFLSVRRPYTLRAGEIIAAVRDRAALPLLKKLIADSDVAPSALAAYEAIVSSVAIGDDADAALAPATIQKLIAARPPGSPEILPRQMRLLALLPIPDALALVSDAVRGAPAEVSGDRADYGAVDMSDYSQNDVRRIAKLLDAVAGLKTRAAFRLLYKQTYGLANAMGFCSRFGQFSNPRPAEAFSAERKKASLSLAAELYDDYLRSVLKISRSLGVDGVIVPDEDWIIDATLRDPRERWLMSFRGFSVHPQIVATVLDRRGSKNAPLIDADGVSWDARAIPLPTGAVFPFEKRIVLRFPPRTKWEFQDASVVIAGPAGELVPKEFRLSSYPEDYPLPARIEPR